jgi:hypothetical protein
MNVTVPPNIPAVSPGEFIHFFAIGMKNADTDGPRER